MTEEKPAKQRSGGALRLASAGVELAVTMAVGCLLGYWIDRKFPRVEPWGLVTGAAIGIIGGLYNLVRQAVHDMVRPPGKGCRVDERGDRTGPDDAKKRTDG